MGTRRTDYPRLRCARTLDRGVPVIVVPRDDRRDHPDGYQLRTARMMERLDLAGRHGLAR